MSKSADSAREDDGEIPAVVEAKPGSGSPDLTQAVLQQRVRQQQILAELGVKALQGPPLEQLFDETARLVAEGLDAEFSKLLEYIADENRLLVRAGVGWGPGVVGVASVGADVASPAGFALRSGTPVISNHLDREERFRTPELLSQHGVRRAMNVILQGDGKPFGVLEVDSRSPRDFEEQDLAFLQGAANIVGMAIERLHNERRLSAALAHHKVLLKEMDHRVKNSLSLVASVLRLQSISAGDSALSQNLDEAARRVKAIAKAHERLYQDAKFEVLDLGQYIERVCRDIDETIAQCQIEVACEKGIEVATRRAISAAMIVNELITNAVKYAYHDNAGNRISISVARAGRDSVTIGVRDYGNGVPQDVDLRTSSGLGQQLVAELTRQLDGQIATHQRHPGTEIVLSMPLRDESAEEPP